MILGLVSMLVLLAAGGTAAGPGDDADSPTDVAMAFARAMDVGDAAVAKSVALNGEEHTQLVDAMATMTRSQQNLLKVASQRFGASAQMLVGPYAAPGLAETVARSKLTVDGDSAVLREQPDMIFLKLRRVEGRWRVDVAGSSETEARRREIPLLADLARICDEAAEQVQAGKYATAEEARTGMIALIRSKKKPAAASNPTTKTAATRP